MIIVEGPDNSGKTTLVDAICEALPGLVRLKSPGVSVNYDWWMKTVTQPPEALANLVCDRFYFSELVYGPICRGNIRLSHQMREVLESMIQTTDPLIIHCELINDEQTFSNRPQIFDWETQKKVAQAYHEIGLYDPPWNTRYYDFEQDMLPDDVIEKFIIPYHHTRDYWTQRRMTLNHGRGQMWKPKLMVVGQSLAKDNVWRVPFERSRSGQLLHDAIRTYPFEFHQIWFTNAYKAKGGLCQSNIVSLQREIELLQPKRILAVGSKAAGVLGVCGAPFWKVVHPAYLLRKKSRTEAGALFTSKIHSALDKMNF